MGEGITLSTAPFYLEPSGDLSVDNNTRFGIFVKYINPSFYTWPKSEEAECFLDKRP